MDVATSVGSKPVSRQGGIGSIVIATWVPMKTLCIGLHAHVCGYAHLSEKRLGEHCHGCEGAHEDTVYWFACACVWLCAVWGASPPIHPTHACSSSHPPCTHSLSTSTQSMCPVTPCMHSSTEHTHTQYKQAVQVPSDPTYALIHHAHTHSVQASSPGAQ